MKRRKGKARKSPARSLPIRLTIERLETRQLLSGFASVAVPGTIDVGTVELIEIAQINVEPVCSAEAGSLCNSTSTNSGRSLSVGDGFGFHYVTASEPATKEPAPVEFAIGPFPQPTGFDAITVITEEPVLEFGPINQRSQPVPEVGIYFTEPQTSLGDEPGNASETATATTGQPRIVSLARVQQFALVSPADFSGPNLPSLDGQVTAGPTSGSVSSTNSGVDAVFENLDSDLLSEAESLTPTDVSDLGLGGAETGSSESTKLGSPVSNPSLEPTLGHLSTPNLGVFPTIPLNVLGDVLQSMDFEEARPESPVLDEAPVNPDLHADDADNKKLVEGIYLVEGVILLAAVPRSLHRRRDDEALDEFSV